MVVENFFALVTFCFSKVFVCCNHVLEGSQQLHSSDSRIKGGIQGNTPDHWDAVGSSSFDRWH
jgi:hypothetical protein